MDSLASFFDTTQEFNLPFVVYRKPNEDRVLSFCQKNASLYAVKDFDEEGFVFAPFDTKCPPILFPTSHCNKQEFDFIEEVSSLPKKKVQSSEEERQRHLQLVKEGIKAIQGSEMQKVVLSRKHIEKIQSGTTSLKTFKRLLNTYPNAFVYCWYHPKVGLWMGATPETLLSVKNRRLETMALAGTQTYVGQENVTWGHKEKEEQALVTQSIVENLSPLVDQGLSINGPFTSRAGSLLHLKTEISAPVDLTKLSLKKVIASLHPTPAICGFPKELAQQFIAQKEGYDRSFYTGYLGELNYKETKTRSSSRRNVENRAYKSIHTTSSLFVNLRCMQWIGAEAHIYVGGGITAGSMPESEWLETENKMATMYAILDTE